MIVPPRSAPVIFTWFMMVLNLSAGSSTASKVFSRVPVASAASMLNELSDSRPSSSASASCGPALLPNRSMAAAYSSVSVFPLVSAVCNSSRATSRLLPSFVAFCSAFFRPAMTVFESRPFFSRLPRNVAASSMESPISSNSVLFVMSPSDSLSTLVPVSWLTLDRRSRRAPASSAVKPHAVSVDCTESMLETTSVPLICANFRNFSDSSSAWSPVTSNLVLTSPTACAASSKLTGISVARSFAMSSSSFSSSPVLPVIVIS